MGTEELDSIILDIHRAPLDKGVWNEVLRKIAAAIGAERGMVFTMPRGDRRVPLHLLHELEPALFREYAATFAPHDIWHHAAIARGRTRAGDLVFDEQLVERKDLLASDFYNDFLRRCGMHRMANVCIGGAPAPNAAPTSAITFYRGEGSEPFDSRGREVLARLAPHLTVAARTLWHLEALARHLATRDALLDSSPVACFGIDRAGLLSYANAEGERALRDGRWLRCSRGQLGASRNVAQPRRIHRALHDLVSGISCSLLMRDAVRNQDALLIGAPAPESLDSPATPVVSALVWVVELHVEKTSTDRLCEVFGLTPAERNLLELLAADHTVKDSAAVLGISPGTARIQLKSIFRKTGRHSQARLLALVHRAGSVLKGCTRTIRLRCSAPPCRRGAAYVARCRRPDARRLR